jgi:hypothetical protein
MVKRDLEGLFFEGIPIKDFVEEEEKKQKTDEIMEQRAEELSYMGKVRGRRTMRSVFPTRTKVISTRLFTREEIMRMEGKSMAETASKTKRARVLEGFISNEVYNGNIAAKINPDIPKSYAQQVIGAARRAASDKVTVIDENDFPMQYRLTPEWKKKIEEGGAQAKEQFVSELLESLRNLDKSYASRSTTEKKKIKKVLDHKIGQLPLPGYPVESEAPRPAPIPAVGKEPAAPLAISLPGELKIKIEGEIRILFGFLR